MIEPNHFYFRIGDPDSSDCLVCGGVVDLLANGSWLARCGEIAVYESSKLGAILKAIEIWSGLSKSK